MHPDGFEHNVTKLFFTPNEKFLIVLANSKSATDGELKLQKFVNIFSLKEGNDSSKLYILIKDYTDLKDKNDLERLFKQPTDEFENLLCLQSIDQESSYELIIPTDELLGLRSNPIH